MAQRAEYMASIDKRSLSRYATKLKARGNEERLIARREALVENRRRKRSIERRDFTSVLNTYHLSNESVTPDSLDSVIFAATHAFSLPKPLRAYTVNVSGEYVRSNVIEGEPGVPLTFDAQVIDINTYEPLPNVLLEMWHCNSTGAYSGIVANGNGSSADATNINKTALCGIQNSNADNVLTFDTVQDIIPVLVLVFCSLISGSHQGNPSSFIYSAVPRVEKAL
ncbi:Intradiol ring-cleavage dioxygenase [Cenococcum geophilum]